jgi:hypothetical protein
MLPEGTAMLIQSEDDQDSETEAALKRATNIASGKSRLSRFGRRQKQSIDLTAQPLMLRQALNWVQQLRLQPAISAVASQGGGGTDAAAGAEIVVADATLWLPGPQGDGEGLSD